MPGVNKALLGQKAAIGRNLFARPREGAPCHTLPDLYAGIGKARDSPLIQRVIAIRQLSVLIHSLERQLSCKHRLISLLLLLWDVFLHESQRSYGCRVNNFCREYSLSGTREISVKCPISWPDTSFGVVGATSLS